ncbi:hypothetical protein GE061_013734 [Apolygus lucorum]|uniref:Uncharacterized protein n=1 Tax=Apolygus lucorum TaxID=248454 RepID=A0A8S9XNT5_APOLU|nr:hypothetical protein GE061_013734 [Apolygus lucorum]
MSLEEKATHQEEYSRHLERKEAARRERNIDIDLARNDSSYLCINFDLEAVLNVPKGEAGQIFYLRKLAVYNFTMFNLNSHDGDCDFEINAFY